nr:hypothetical protein [Tanacetum cinerariifolium]GEY17299.1 hypothetical protein [Tanacetum cinerariifolium]
MQKIIKQQVKEQVKVQVSKILPRIEHTINKQLEVEVLTRSSHSLRTSYVVAADLLEMELKKILIEKIEGNKMKNPSLDQTGCPRDAEKEMNLSQQALLRKLLPGALADQHKGLNLDKHRQASMLLQRSLCRPSHPEWFSQQQKPLISDHDWNKTMSATHESIQPWISELAKRSDSRSSFNELMDIPLDFSNFLINWLKVDTLTSKLQAGPTYELIKGSCKSLVELEYHLEEVFKATTDQLDWVNLEGQQYPHNLFKPLPLIPKNRGRRVIPFEHFINNDLEYLRGGQCRLKNQYDMTSMPSGSLLLGGKRQQFYGFAVNRESARDVYSKRRIITVTELKIVEWHSYKHLDWITVRTDDDKLYKFKEGDFKRLRIQDIEDMLLLLVQGKLNNLTVEERFAFNNEDKKNRLMRIDELHKFSDGTLTDVRTALDDRLKGIRMQYLPQSIWRKSEKDRAIAMVQAIDKRLKTRRIMRSLKRFVGGRLNEGDFRMLQRTI